MSSHRSPDTTTAPLPKGKERELCWQDAWNSGRKCNILTTSPRKALYSEERSSAGNQIVQGENHLPFSQLSEGFPSGYPQAKDSAWHTEEMQGMRSRWGVMWLRLHFWEVMMVMIWKTDMSGGDLDSKGQNWHNWRGWKGEIKWERHGRDQLLHVSKGHALHCAFSAMAPFLQPREGKSQYTSEVADPPKSPRTFNTPLPSPAVLIVNRLTHLFYMETRPRWRLGFLFNFILHCLGINIRSLSSQVKSGWQS